MVLYLSSRCSESCLSQLLSVSVADELVNKYKINMKDVFGEQISCLVKSWFLFIFLFLQMTPQTAP